MPWVDSGDSANWVDDAAPAPEQDISAQQAATAIQMGPQGGDNPLNVPPQVYDLTRDTSNFSGGADLNALYQQLLGRGVDPSGAATFANMSSQDVANALINSQEYAGRVSSGLSPSVEAALASLQGNDIGFLTAPAGMNPKDYAANGYDASGKKKQSLFASQDPTQVFNFTNPANFQTKDYQNVSQGNPFVQDINNVYMSLLGRPATPTEILNDSKMLSANPDDYNKLIGRVLDSSEFTAATKSGKQNLLGGTAAYTRDEGDSSGVQHAAIDPLTNTTNWLGMSYGKYKPSEEPGGIAGLANKLGPYLPGIAAAIATYGASIPETTAMDVAMAAPAYGGAVANAGTAATLGAETAANVGINAANAATAGIDLGTNFTWAPSGAGAFTPQELEAINLGQQDANAAINTGTQSAGNPSYLENAPIESTYSRNFVDQAPFESDFPTQGSFEENFPTQADLPPARETTLLEDIQNGSKDALDWAKENPYSAAAILGTTAIGILGLTGKGPLSFLGPLVGTSKKPETPPTDPNKPGAPGAPGKPGTPGGPGTPGTPKGLPINPKTGKPYGTGELDPNYLLRNRINAGNVYSTAAGYTKPFAQGGEVRHFGLGGLSDSLTKVFQPIEKSVVQPIGQSVPFLKDALPYAGMIAAPFIASPVAAAGVGALASGIGQGGFNLKRALMGGISAYGLSNLGGGVEAAGSLTPAAETAGVSIPSEANNFFRSPETMTQGLQNLAAGGDSYKLAATNFATKAGMPSAAMSIMGAAGVNAVNEGINQQEQSNQAQATADATGAASKAKIERQKQIARDTVAKYPFQFAMGGSIDDEYGVDDLNTSMGNMQNGFAGFATGGRFLSGGGDGMSDSIHASIEGNQEARLADGEFVIPADVVSHIGNGSSKAGAKQLYNMMDRIRQARTGNKKQGREIKPTKFMPA